MENKSHRAGDTGSYALIAEAVGTMLLLAVVVGSGIMGARLSPDLPALALLANAAATAGALYVLITLLGPISGAHFNPCVTLCASLNGEMSWPRAFAYISMQLVGAVAGVLLAHAMFELPLWQLGSKVRTGFAQYLSEFVATVGLLACILIATRQASKQIPALVASYIFAAYWFTASTSFANPAVTLARALTDSFAGIRPQDVLAFVWTQLLALAFVVVCRRVIERGVRRM
jgi:glycerol uptake facilitator-like aquaporin